LVHIPERQEPLPRTVRFFKTENGNEPVRDWIKGHAKAEWKLIGEDIKTAQWSEEWKAPLVKYLGDGLYEIRTNLFYTIARVLFFTDGNEMVLVHGFTKKSRQIPKAEHDLALKRKRQHEKAN
jgi:phage-related protein